MEHKINRRDFISAASIVGGGISLGFTTFNKMEINSAKQVLKIGIIGLNRGLLQANMLKKNAGALYEIIAVCDLYQNKVDDAIKDLNLMPSQGYTDYHIMLKDKEIEAVLVEVGTQVQSQICCDVLNAGKHVLCDVPLAFTLEQSQELVDTVEKTGLVFCMGEQVRFGNFVQKWKEHIEKGDIGKVLFVQGEYIHPLPTLYFEDKKGHWPSETRSIEDVARDPEFKKTWRNKFVHPIKYISHELSPLLKIIDDRIIKTSCFFTDARMYKDAIGMLDFECALFYTEKGTTIRIANSFTAPRGGHFFNHWYHIMGTDGYLESSRKGWGTEGELICRKDGSFEKTNYGWEREDMPFGSNSEGHSGLESFVFQDFYDAIRKNKKPEVDIYTAIDVSLPGIIAAESAEAGGIQMKVPDLRLKYNR